MTLALEPEVINFLDAQRLAHLATVDTSGAPHVVPVCFALHAPATTLYIAIDEKPKRADFRRLQRLRNITANPRVAIVADVYDDSDWSRLGFVLLRALARILEPGPAEHASAIHLLRDKYPQYRGMSLEVRPVIAADIQSATHWGALHK